MQSILGIDVSKDKLDLILMANGKRYHRVISNNPKGFQVMDKWLRSYHAEDLHACLEASGQAPLRTLLASIVISMMR